MYSKRLFKISTLGVLGALVFCLPTSAASYVNLNVPFTTEAPLGKWVDPWFNGCEEASLVMVDMYYKDKKSLSPNEAANAMKNIFAWEDKIFGSNTDTNAAETSKIANDFLEFNATVERDPTLEQIKSELANGHPVIVPLNGDRYYGRHYGNGYHMFVIKGYDDNTREFIVHDDGTSKGKNVRVSYNFMMALLTDFDLMTKKINNKPAIILTSPKKQKVIVLLFHKKGRRAV